ncbi:Os10g0376450 [Oryza sativa Japonica Group]|uniref:Os10g0376450 protein n=1 Tax=Oryza sativa subsp. japonica TaxID=39947 RepID=A0A0P0XTF9_ORYSJ|nr:Os10g0376450 [Oryza sativa Japonica Group]
MQGFQGFNCNNNKGHNVQCINALKTDGELHIPKKRKHLSQEEHQARHENLKNLQYFSHGQPQSETVTVKQGDASENNTNSPEELQIQDELEADIEEDLEREIIDDMCRLTRHLQRLYQQRDLRQLTGSATSYQMPLYHTTTEVLSEINIRINLDGQCNINITKIEQDDDTENQRKTCPNAYQSDKRQGHVKARQTYTVSRRKQQNHPVAPWR